jgi:hypothetical protein
MQSCFLFLQFLDQFLDPLFRQRIRNLSGQHAVSAYSLFEFLAFITHGSPRSIRRERAALSVIDGYRHRAMITLTIHALSGSRHYSIMAFS